MSRLAETKPSRAGARLPAAASPATAYCRFAEYLEARVGITLGPGKAYLVESRLAPLHARFGLRDLEALVEALERGDDKTLQVAVIDAMTTNETQWFRDEYPYRILDRQVFPGLLEDRRALRIWSAACSSGQEPYSISMAAHDYFKRCGRTPGQGVEILGTDVSRAALDQAERAVFSAAGGVRGLSSARLRDCFSALGDRYELNAALREPVSFCALNLLGDLSALGRFDIVFLRNVLIYFSQRTREDLLARVAEVITPGGYLFLGASESIHARNVGLRRLRLADGVVYQKRA